MSIRARETERRPIQMKTAITILLAMVILTCSGCKEKAEVPSTPPSVSLLDAAWEGNLEAVQQHIAAGSDLNEKNPSGATPIEHAATSGQTEVVRVLIKAGADVNSRNNRGGTPLHAAAFFCRTDIVKVLLDNDADKNARNNDGTTAYESVAGPFDDVKGIYDYLGATLAPAGLKLDYERIKATRPKIAKMLQQ